MLVLNNRVALAEDISNYAKLKDAITAASNNAVISIGNIDFGNTAGAIIIDKSGLTLQGNTSSNFATQIAELSASIFAQGTSITLNEDNITKWSLDTSNVSSISSSIQSTRTITTSTGYQSDSERLDNKWLTTPGDTSNASAANGLSLKNIKFSDVDVEYDNTFIANGLIGNSRKATADTSMGDITGNAFTDITVLLNGHIDTQYLAGGGIIGVRATGEELPETQTASATMGKVSGNYFDNIEIITTQDNNTNFMDGSNTETQSKKSAYLEGGGLIGVNAVSSPGDVAGYSRIEQLNNNLFTNVKILSNDIILGGGLVGANNNSKLSDLGTYARIDDASGNIFGDVNVKAGYSLRGGGVIGLNGLGSAEVDLKNLTNNIFANTSVQTGTYIRGGGIIGLQTNDGGTGKGSAADNVADNYVVDDGDDTTWSLDASQARIGNASGNVFLNEEITVGSYLQGGGVIGLRSNAGTANLDTLKNNIFKDIHVTVNGKSVPEDVGVELNGGGIVGLSAEEYAVLGGSSNNVQKNYFDDISVTVTGTINGGGIIGVNARDQTLVPITAMDGVDQNLFQNSSVTATNINGGGIIGVNAGLGINSFGTISGNTFSGLTVSTAKTKETDPDSGYISGGGIIGLKAEGVAYLGKIINNQFLNNTVKAGTYIDGGGIIGVTGDDGTNPLAGIGLIDQSVFSGNKVSAKDVVMGGIVYSYGINNGMTIRDSQFIGNTMSSTDNIVYGTVSIDTGLSPLDAYELMLTATNGKSTVFQDNQITDTNTSLNLEGTRTNSLYFGTIPNADESADPSDADATLIVAPQAGGLVALYDPIWVNQNNGHTFDMNVTGAGNFLWGGTNVLTTDAADISDVKVGTINLKAGSTTTILDGSSTTTFVNGQWIANDAKNTMSLNAPNFTFSLENGALLNIEGHNTFDLSNNVNDTETIKASLNGRLHFNLNNTEVYHQGELPSNYSSDIAYTPLLTIQTPDSDGNDNQQMVDLNHSTILLSSFEGGHEFLDPGDRFYLIEVQNSIENNPDNHAFTDANPSNSTAYARHGLIGYTFIIDKNLDNLGNEENTRFLVARLQSRGPAEEFEPPTTGLTFLQRGSDRLANLPLYDIDPYSPSPCSPCGIYEPCDPCEPCGMSEGNMVGNAGGSMSNTGWIWTPWATVEGAWYRVNGNADAYADVRGTLFFGGFSVQKKVDNGRIFLGAFVDVGDADYGTFNDYSNVVLTATPRIRGDGELDSVGGGIFLRRKWNGGLRFDAMFRGGNIKDKFISHDLITNGIPMHFQLDGAYWGTNVGFDYEWRRGRNTFDIYSRYLWLMTEAQSVVLSTGEPVDFQAIHSHRIYSGGRLTRQWKNDWSWYLGAAYEYELDGTARATERFSGFNYAFEAPPLRGGTGIGELGLVYRRNEEFHAVLGLEGYVGKREGGAGSITAVWKW
jgi:hypothetical protein